MDGEERGEREREGGGRKRERERERERMLYNYGQELQISHIIRQVRTKKIIFALFTLI